MTTRSNTAPAGTFLPVSILISLVVLLATLFALLQAENLPLFASATAVRGAARAPFFRGLVYLPEFRFLPFLRGVAPDAAAPDAALDESQMPPDERINRWEPYIKEASHRYAIPEKWIRTIINIESGGRTMLWGRPITSGAGAMGVMQLMRDTYNDMSVRNGLGSDPYDVHDNILAGTAYLRELYNRYGYPRLFEAYNAGPGVLEAHMQHGSRLPAETVNYVRMAVISTASPAAAKKAVAEAVRQPVKAKAAKSAPVRLAAHKTAPAKHAVHLAAARRIHVATAKPVHVAVHSPHSAGAAHGKHRHAAA